MNQRLGRVLDGTICAAGCLVSLVVALPWIRRPETLPIGTVVVALAIVALSRVPMRLPSRAGMVEITFAPAALVYLSLRGSVSSTALLWLVVSTIMFLGERHKPLSDRVFNIGCVSLSGVVLLGIVSLRNGLLKPSTLLLVALGCAAFFLVDLFLTMLTLSVARGVVMSEVLEPSRCVVPLVCFIGIDSLGYLAALLQRAYPAWAMGLLAVPLLTIFVALRSLDRARESERRTQAIYAIVKAASGVDSSPDITNLLEASLSDLMPNRTVLIRDEPPGELEIGAALSLEGTPSRWLIVLQGRAYGFTPSEVETVEALTTVSVEMLERQQLVGKITQLARFDVLTGLTNRSVFLDRLELALDRLTRGGGSVAVLYCDLDGFKGVNDRLGHEAGDHVIVAVADRLRAQLRPSDTASRLGGDEFAVLVEDVRDVEIARSLAERIVEALRFPFDIDGQIVRLGASVGVAFTAVDSGAEELLHGADVAMYSAKAAGRNRVEVFDAEMRHHNDRQLILEDELRGALEGESLRLAWQPLVEIESGRLDGFEVLVRWSHPQLGEILPDVLMPIASQIGVMQELGRWVLREAHRSALELSAVAGRPLTLAVNVAAEQLRDDVFLADVETLAADPRVRLVIELTEHTLIDNGTASVQLDRLHAAGVAVAIDDFGVGYSSISYLHQFRCIDTVKIDRSFIALLSGDPRTRALVHSVMEMARAFDAIVVAEGIEDVETLERVRELGCRLGQGFLFGRPEGLPRALEIAEQGILTATLPTP